MWLFHLWLLTNGKLLFHGLEIGVHNIAVCFFVAFSILCVQLSFSFLSLSLFQALKYLSQALRPVSGFSSPVSYLVLSSLFLASGNFYFLAFGLARVYVLYFVHLFCVFGEKCFCIRSIGHVHWKFYDRLLTCSYIL